MGQRHDIREVSFCPSMKPTAARWRGTDSSAACWRWQLWCVCRKGDGEGVKWCGLCEFAGEADDAWVSPVTRVALSGWGACSSFGRPGKQTVSK